MDIALATLADTLLEPNCSASGTNTPSLLFFHIGRTGGTSLTRYFGSLARHCHVQFNPDDDLPLPAFDGDTCPDFISGHYPVSRWLHRLPASWRTMMVFRDPIQHLLSSYWHIRTHPDVTDSPDLQSLIEDARRSDLGTLLRERAGASFQRHFDNPQTRFLLAKHRGALDAGDLARANALITSLTFVGITERLDEFAAQVAASLPWAAGWQDADLPRMMVNPLNVLGASEISRDLLHCVLAATELDAELYQRARQLRSERRSSSAGYARAVSNSTVNPMFAARAIPVVDLIRVSAVQVQGARYGHEFYLDGDEIVLHPPERSKGFAAIVIEDMALDGCSEIRGRLGLAHEDAAPVVFRLELRQNSTVIVTASFTVTRVRPVDIRLRFPPASGSARLELRTEMAQCNANDFAWATFTGLTMG